VPEKKHGQEAKSGETEDHKQSQAI